MRTAHLISDALFEKAWNALISGEKYIVYDSSKYLLETTDVYFLKDEIAARVFSDNHRPSSENMKIFKADSVMAMYEHFEIKEILKNINSHLKNEFMEENNYEQMTKSLLYAGYGDTLNEQLKAKMDAGEKEFTLSHHLDLNKEKAGATLYFRKSDTTEKYFFNKHELSISKEGAAEPITQTFYINYMQDNITLKEGMNMLQGRAVYKELQNKEGEKYNAWVQLNFKETEASGNFKMRTFNEGYGFRLAAVLEKYQIAGLKNEDEKKMLMQSLERGNRQSITLEADGMKVKAFVEASPQYKGLNFYDEHMKKKLSHELTSADGQKQSGNKQTAKASPGDEIEGKSQKRRTARRPAM